MSKQHGHPVSPPYSICILIYFNHFASHSQVYGISAPKAASQLYHEYAAGGVLNLYRGLLSPLCMRFASSSVMFGSYSQYRRAFRNRLGLRESTSKLCGAVMAGASEAVLMPFERVQVLMQERKYHGVYRCVQSKVKLIMGRCCIRCETVALCAK